MGLESVRVFVGTGGTCHCPSVRLLSWPRRRLPTAGIPALH